MFEQVERKGREDEKIIKAGFSGIIAGDIIRLRGAKEQETSFVLFIIFIGFGEILTQIIITWSSSLLFSFYSTL